MGTRLPSAVDKVTWMLFTLYDVSTQSPVGLSTKPGRTGDETMWVLSHTSRLSHRWTPALLTLLKMRPLCFKRGANGVGAACCKRADEEGIDGGRRVARKSDLCSRCGRGQSRQLAASCGLGITVQQRPTIIRLEDAKDDEDDGCEPDGIVQALSDVLDDDVRQQGDESSYRVGTAYRKGRDEQPGVGDLFETFAKLEQKGRKPDIIGVLELGRCAAVFECRLWFPGERVQHGLEETALRRFKLLLRVCEVTFDLHETDRHASADALFQSHASKHLADFPLQLASARPCDALPCRPAEVPIVVALCLRRKEPADAH